MREGRGSGADAAQGADHVARRRMLQRLQAVRRPPWKRPTGATGQDAADAVGVHDVRLAGYLDGVAQRRRGGSKPRVVLVLLLLVEVLQRRREEHTADTDPDRISARDQRRHQAQSGNSKIVTFQKKKKKIFILFFSRLVQSFRRIIGLDCVNRGRSWKRVGFLLIFHRF